MTEVFTIKQCLDGEVQVDAIVSVKGWVKTRRDSKAGLSIPVKIKGKAGKLKLL